MKIYVASSWSNRDQPGVVLMLSRRGHDVYDFRNPPGRAGFGWEQLGLRGMDPNNATSTEWRAALAHPIAQAGFDSDMRALRECDACVLVLPGGRDAHLELGWACGAGKRTVVLASLDRDRIGLMPKMADAFCVSTQEMIDALEK